MRVRLVFALFLIAAGLSVAAPTLGARPGLRGGLFGVAMAAVLAAGQALAPRPARGARSRVASAVERAGGAATSPVNRSPAHTSRSPR